MEGVRRENGREGAGMVGWEWEYGCECGRTRVGGREEDYES